MSTVKITFTDKDNNQPSTDPRRKFTDDDANEIKDVVNTHADNIDTNVHDIDVLEREATMLTQNLSNPSSITPDTDYYDVTQVKNLAQALTINNPSGSPVGNEIHIIKVKDSGGSQTLNFDTKYRAIGAALPAATTAGKQTIFSCQYDAVDDKWDTVTSTEV